MSYQLHQLNKFINAQHLYCNTKTRPKDQLDYFEIWNRSAQTAFSSKVSTCRQKEQCPMAVGRKTREEIVNWNQMTALRFHTGGRHQTSLASLWGNFFQKNNPWTDFRLNTNFHLETYHRWYKLYQLNKFVEARHLYCKTKTRTNDQLDYFEIWNRSAQTACTQG